MTIRLVILLSLLLAPFARAEEPALADDEQKTLYALGLSLARNLASFELGEKDLEVVKLGLTDGTLGRPPKVPLETFGPKIAALAQERREAAAATEKKAAADFLAKAAGEKGAEKTESGLIIQEVHAGTGPRPGEKSTVKVHYHGTLRDGSVFDSSVDRKEPATFPLNQVIPCWTEGLQKMKVGGKSRLVCPSEIAYKDVGRPPVIRPGAPLVFDVELLEIVK